MRPRRSQTRMKTENVHMRPVQKSQNFQFIPLARQFSFFRWLLLACAVPMSRLQPRPVWNVFVFTRLGRFFGIPPVFSVLPKSKHRKPPEKRRRTGKNEIKKANVCAVSALPWIAYDSSHSWARPKKVKRSLKALTSLKKPQQLMPAQSPRDRLSKEVKWYRSVIDGDEDPLN